MMGAKKNTPLYRRLYPVCERLGGKVSANFAGLIVGKRSVLYRHAQYWTNHGRKGQKYEQLTWGKPFGSTEEHKIIDFVLLHASKPEEIFFLFPVAKAKLLARTFPGNLNVAVSPIRDVTIRDKVEPFRVRFSDLKRVLNK
jgi:hypothetical protein